MSTPVGERSHLSIGEVLALLQQEFPDITISKIRFLESQGLLDPERTPSGYRKFYDGDIERLRWILRQQREHFLPLKVIKGRLERGELDDPPPGVDGVTPTVVPEPAGGPPPADAEADVVARPEPAGADASTDPVAEPGGGGGAGAGAADDEDDAGAGGEAAAGGSPAANPLDNGPSSVSMSREELAAAAGLDLDDIADLERFGLLAPKRVGGVESYDDHALVVARLAAGFLGYGVEGRHLRMYKIAAEREAGFYEQVIMPLVKQRNPAARRQAVDTLRHLASLGQSLHAAMLRAALRQYTERG